MCKKKLNLFKTKRKKKKHWKGCSTNDMGNNSQCLQFSCKTECFKVLSKRCQVKVMWIMKQTQADADWKKINTPVAQGGKKSTLSVRIFNFNGIFASLYIPFSSYMPWVSCLFCLFVWAEPYVFSIQLAESKSMPTLGILQISFSNSGISNSGG